MKNRLMQMGFSLALTLGYSVHAQDYQKDSYETPTGTDGGVDAVYKAQEAPIQPPAQEADATTPLTADQQLRKFMKVKGFETRYDEEKGRIFVTGIAEFDCESPAADPDFLVKREMLTKQAILEAKIKIIESINSKMSASTQITVPGSPLATKFQDKIDKANATLEKMKRRVRKLKAYMDTAELQKLDGITWTDLGKKTMAEIITKIDKKFNTGEIEAKKKAKYEKTKANYLAAKADMNAIAEKAKALQGSLQKEMKSSVSKVAKMPLFGSTVIAQAESWDEFNEIYQVAVLVCWSNSLHRAARAIATGEDYKLATKKSSKKLSINQWLEKQNLAVMCGPRQYLDKDGNRWYLAVSARHLPKASSQRERARDLTTMFASQMATYCIYSDLASQKTASQMMQVRNAGQRDDTQVAESMAKSLSNTFKNKTVRGLNELLQKQMIHPISGEKIVVSVYGITPHAAVAALEIEKKNWATAIQSEKHQSLEKGRDAANKAAVEKAKNDRASYNKGYNGRTKDLNDEVAKREGVRAAKERAEQERINRIRAEKMARARQEKIRLKRAQEEADRKSQSGAFQGDSEVDDDF